MKTLEPTKLGELINRDTYDKPAVACPTCGGTYSHIGPVEQRLGIDESKPRLNFPTSGTPSGSRRDGIAVSFNGECGHNWTWVFVQHKGTNFFTVELGPDSPMEQTAKYGTD